jgi:hypothetical protein
LSKPVKLEKKTVSQVHIMVVVKPSIDMKPKFRYWSQRNWSLCQSCGLTLKLYRLPCSAMSALSCRVRPLTRPPGTAITGSASMSALFIVMKKSPREKWKRRGRRAQLRGQQQRMDYGWEEGSGFFRESNVSREKSL